MGEWNYDGDNGKKSGQKREGEKLEDGRSLISDSRKDKKCLNECTPDNLCRECLLVVQKLFLKLEAACNEGTAKQPNTLQYNRAIHAEKLHSARKKVRLKLHFESN